MASFIGVQVSGLDAVLKRLGNLRQDVEEKLDVEMDIAAENIESTAKKLAPVDMGQLQNSIGPGQNAKLHKEIEVTAAYAPFVEFGTGKKVKIPADLADYAAQFRGGNGGTFDEMVESIKEWCKRHGIDPKAAYPIAISILRNGSAPQPFLFPALEAERKPFIENVKKALKNL